MRARVKFSSPTTEASYLPAEREAFVGLAGEAVERAVNRDGEAEVLVVFDEFVKLSDGRTLGRFWFLESDLVFDEQNEGGES